MNQDYNKIKIFTDGACKGNPGPGGWGAVIISQKYRKALKLHFSKNKQISNRRNNKPHNNNYMKNHFNNNDPMLYLVPRT